MDPTQDGNFNKIKVSSIKDFIDNGRYEFLKDLYFAFLSSFYTAMALI